MLPHNICPFIKFFCWWTVCMFELACWTCGHLLTELWVTKLVQVFNKICIKGKHFLDDLPICIRQKSTDKNRPWFIVLKKAVYTTTSVAYTLGMGNNGSTDPTDLKRRVYATNDICYTMPNFFLLFCLETADKKIVDFKHLPYLSVSNECFCMDTADSTFSIISRKCAPWASVYSLIPSNFMSPLIVVAFMIKVSSDMPSAQTTACSGISLNRYHQKKV